MTKLARLCAILATAASASSTVALEAAESTLQQITTPRSINLTIEVFDWAGNLCGLHGCPPLLQLKQDLNIDKATCPLLVRVANHGNADSTSFLVEISFTGADGKISRQATVVPKLSGRNSGDLWYRDVTFTEIGYFRTDKPFTIVVDPTGNIVETDKTDNRQTKLLN